MPSSPYALQGKAIQRVTPDKTRAWWARLKSARTPIECVEAIDRLLPALDQWEHAWTSDPLPEQQATAVLHAATIHNRVDMAECCLKQGVSPSAPNGYGDDGVLLMLRYRHHTELANLYCDHGHAWATTPEHVARYRQAWEGESRSETPQVGNESILQRLMAVGDRMKAMAGESRLDAFMSAWLLAQTLAQPLPAQGNPKPRL